MKKLGLITIVLIGIILISGCYEGRTGKGGEILKRYLPEDSLKSLVENPVDSIWIVDVRPIAAYNNGHIPSAISFPSSEIMDRLDEIPKEQYLILYCETGGRAQLVMNKLIEVEYSRVMNWGSYKRWRWEYEVSE